jgi:hypothetical protein
MKALNDLEQLLRSWTRKRRTAAIPLAALLQGIGKWSGEIRQSRPDFTDFSTYTPSLLAELFEKAEKEGICLQRTEGGNRVLVYLGYFVYVVRSAYEGMEGDNERPFPAEEGSGFLFPPEVLQIVDVKADFIDLLRGALEIKSPVLKLTFPEGIRSMLILPEMAKEKILDLSMSKMRQYLTIRKNVDYVNHRLLAAFPSKERSIRDMINNILTQRDTALSIVKDPDDFTFQFWSHFMSVIMKDFREKETKLEREHAFSQAGYLIGMYNLYYKGRKRTRQEKEHAFQVIEKSLMAAPYCHTFLDISSFRDPKGFPVSRTIKQKELTAYLEKKTEPGEGGPLPSILRIRDAAGHEFYILKEKLLQLCLKKVVELGRIIRRDVAKEWGLHLGEFKKIPEMTRREALETDLWRRIKNQDPLLFSLLKYELLAVVLHETKPSREVYIETERLLDSKKEALVPIDDILRFDRKTVLNEARTYIPLWKSIPVIGRLGVFLQRLFRQMGDKASFIKDPSEVYARFSGGDREEKSEGAPAHHPGVPDEGFRKLPQKHPETESSSPSTAAEGRKTKEARLQQYRKAVHDLKVAYVGEGGNLISDMKKLEEQWNPLYDEKAKANLVEDVNAMIRDFMRRLKRGFSISPPDRERIHELAKKVATSESLKEIKRKEPLMRYIELYMIEQLGKK